MIKNIAVRFAACAAFALAASETLPAAELAHRWSFNGDPFVRPDGVNPVISPNKKTGFDFPTPETLTNLTKRAWGVLEGNIVAESSAQWAPLRGVVPSAAHFHGIWNWDAAFHTLAFVRRDAQLARDQFRIMMNTEGNSYVEYYWADAYVELSSEFAPFLIPNQFCSYVPSSACVEKARELTNDATNQGEAVRNICEFVARNTSYDKAKAEKLANESGYVPNPDETLATGRGICFDYASLSAAMLRSMGLPAKVVTGYVGEENLYHAWIMVYIDGTWETAVFSVTPNNWSRCDVTFASTGATKYTGSGTSYTDRYTY